MTRTVCLSSVGNPSTTCCSTILGLVILGTAVPCCCAHARSPAPRPASRAMPGTRLLRICCSLCWPVATRFRRKKSRRLGPAAGAAGLLDPAPEVHNGCMFDWNDLKHFLAVARHGSTIAAGKALGTSQSTVHRRLEELERRIGQALVTRAASGYRLTEYGTTLLPFAERIEDLSQHLLIGFDETLAGHRAAKWLKDVAPEARMPVRNNSVLGLVSAVKSGAGLGPLPTALGDAEPDLVRVLGPISELTRSWRLLTHPDIRRVPRIAAFFDYIIEQRDALKSILTG